MSIKKITRSVRWKMLAAGLALAAAVAMAGCDNGVERINGTFYLTEITFTATNGTGGFVDKINKSEYEMILTEQGELSFKYPIIRWSYAIDDYDLISKDDYHIVYKIQGNDILYEIHAQMPNSGIFEPSGIKINKNRDTITYTYWENDVGTNGNAGNIYIAKYTNATSKD